MATLARNGAGKFSGTEEGQAAIRTLRAWVRITNHCEHCTASNARNGTHQNLPTPSEPARGFLSERGVEGYEHALVLIDAHSGMVEVNPLRRLKDTNEHLTPIGRD